MSQHPPAMDRINALKAEIAALEQSAIGELYSKRTNILTEIAQIDAKISDFTGKAVKGTKTRVRSTRSVSLTELTDLLHHAPEKTVNVRKEKLDFANIKTLASANPHILKLAGKGPWPTVTLLN